VLTATCIDLHIENSKNDKNVILATSHRLNVNVLLNNITFLSFLLFSMWKSIQVGPSR